MKIGCSSRSFRKRFDDRSLDLVSFVDLAADIGLDGIEAASGAFPSVSKKFQRELRDRLDRRFVELSAISLANDFAISDPAERRAQTDDLVAWTGLARDLGARTIRALTGLSGADTLPDEARRRVAECFATALPAAERAGITLAVTEDGDDPLFSPDALDALVMQFGSANLQLCLGPAGFESPRAARHAVCARLPFPGVDADGLPSGTHVPRFLDLCRRACFSGTLSLEYHGEGDAEDTVRRAIAALRLLLEG